MPESLHAALTGRDIEVLLVSDGFTALGAVCRAHGRKGPPPSFVVVEREEGGKPRRVGEVLRAMDIYAPRSVAWAYTSAGGLRGVTSEWARDEEQDEPEEAIPTPRVAVSPSPRQPALTLRLTEDPSDYESEAESEELEQQLTDEELSMLLAPPDEAGGESKRGER